MKRKQMSAGELDERNAALTLAHKLKREKKPDPCEVSRLRNLVRVVPELVAAPAAAMDNVRQELVAKISANGLMQAQVLAQCDVLRDELGGAQAPPLEQLLIDHILTLRLRLLCVETAFTQLVLNAPSCSYHLSAFRDAQLTTAQTRYLRAIETLARVRKLARSTPALQVNIAAGGGQQVNVQGDTKR